MLERLQHYIATTAPTKRYPCKKAVVMVKACQHMGACDARAAQYRNESELRKVEEEEGVLKRRRMDIEALYEQEGIRTGVRVTVERYACSIPLNPLLGGAQNSRVQ